VHELKGENADAELSFRQSYSTLNVNDRNAQQQKLIVLNNMANAALKSADYVTGIRIKLAGLLNLSVQI